MTLFRRILCFLGFHSGRCYDGAYRCLHCSYTDSYREAGMKKMSPKTFREFAELALKNYRQRIEREEAEG